MSPLTSRRRRPLNRPTHFRDANIYVIATEGSCTEKDYFSIFKNPKIQVIVLPCDENKSAPNHILENLVKYKEIYELGENDELWLVIDVDRWGDKKLGQVAAESNQRSFNLAVSNPCFEVWLYLHFDEIKETKLSCNELEKKLKDSLGSYDKSKLDKRRYEQNNISNAIARAKKLDSNPSERWPTSVGTHVYKLIERIIPKSGN